MRIVIALLLTAWTSAAHAERLYSPVVIKQTTGICRDFASLKYRDGLISQNRTESLSGLNTMSALTGECNNVPAGQWMFLDGWSDNYVCLRPRLGADCAWVRRTAVGDIVELFPGRTFQQGNKGVTCQNWGQVIQKSKATEAENNAKYSAVTPKNFGETLAKGALATVIGTFTGGAAYDEIQHANRCDIWFATAQETARRLTAYRACPALGANGQQQTEQASYDGLLRLVNDSCVPR